jgi:hypothetical protein
MWNQLPYIFVKFSPAFPKLLQVLFLYKVIDFGGSLLKAFQDDSNEQVQEYQWHHQEVAEEEDHCVLCATLLCLVAVRYEICITKIIFVIALEKYGFLSGRVRHNIIPCFSCCAS